jgi:hypothetical protein
VNQRAIREPVFFTNVAMTISWVSELGKLTLLPDIQAWRDRRHNISVSF